jgi:DNA-binding response OmpR family regulator
MGTTAERGAHILVIEDDPAVARSLQEALAPSNRPRRATAGHVRL